MKKTKLFAKPVMFADGEDRLFMQQHKLFIGDHDSGVVVVSTGHVGRDDTKREFTFDGTGYITIKEAMRAAGHELEEDE